MASKISLGNLQELMSEKDPDLELTSFEVAPGSGRGDNYTAKLYRIRLTGVKAGEDWEQSVIYKCLPDNTTLREAFKSDALFCNEVAFYNKIIPALDRFGRSTFNATPRCYAARNDALILEDLLCRGFHMADRKTGLNADQCGAVLKELAAFHAVSLAMKTERPDEFYELLGYQNGITERLFHTDNEIWYQKYYDEAAKNALAMVEETLSPDERSTYLEKFESFVSPDTFFRTMVELVAPVEPLAVLCHGDCWTNNILFRTENDSISEVCFVDFQLVRYGSPALDLANLIYCCTSREQRDEQLESMLRTYHETLHARLTELTPESKRTSDIFDKDSLWTALNAEFHRCGKFGLGLALDMIPISTCDSDQAPDLYQDEDTDRHDNAPVCTTNELCRRRMSDLVCELVDKGVL